MSDFTVDADAYELVDFQPEPKAAIPPLVRRQIKDYVDKRVPPGWFVRCLLENDLMNSVKFADKESLKALPEIVEYMRWEIPSRCWGSVLKVDDYLNRRNEPNGHSRNA